MPEEVTSPRTLALVRATYDRLAEHYGEGTRRGVRELYRGLLGAVERSSVFEAGCGAGEDTEWLLQRGAKVVAADISPRMLDLAKNRTKGFKATLQLSNSETVELAQSGVDLVLSVMEIVHHDYLGFTLSRYSHQLRVGGHLLLVTNHPIRNTLLRDSGNYFAERRYAEDWGELGAVDKQHWTLESYFKALASSNLLVREFREIEGTPDILRIQDRLVESQWAYPSFAAFLCQKND